MADNPLTMLKNILVDEEMAYNEIVEKLHPILEEKGRSEKRINGLRKLISDYEPEESLKESSPDVRQELKVTKNADNQSATDLIRAIADTLSGDYTVQTTKDIFESKYPEFNFSRYAFHNVIQDRLEKGVTIEVKKGKGKNPSIFRNIRQKNIFEDRSN